LSVLTAVKLVCLHEAVLLYNGYEHAKAPASTSENTLGGLIGPARRLSTADEGRLQRAFYRYEIYVHLFNSDIHSQGRTLFKDARSPHFFLQKFTLGEVGHIENVDAHLRLIVGYILDQFERASPEKRPIVFSLDGSDVASMGLPWSIMRNNTTDCLLSTGVAKLSHLFRAEEEEQRRNISSQIGNDTTVSSHSLAAALELYPPRPWSL